jgi:hypothetical protein
MTTMRRRFLLWFCCNEESNDNYCHPLLLCV